MYFASMHKHLICSSDNFEVNSIQALISNCNDSPYVCMAASECIVQCAWAFKKAWLALAKFCTTVQWQLQQARA